MNKSDQKIVRAMIGQLQEMNSQLEIIRKNLDAKYEAMSERKQESEAGEKLAEEIERIDGTQCAIEGVWEDIESLLEED